MNQAPPTKFTIRVYGLFTNDQNEILITDEFQLNTQMTKFPGGGLHFGEGTMDCLKRETLNPDELTFPIDKHVANLLKRTLNIKM